MVRDGGVVRASVKPEKLDISDPLASVGGATNALTFRTDLMGNVTIIGAGAGKIETGYSILVDLLTIHRAAIIEKKAAALMRVAPRVIVAVKRPRPKGAKRPKRPQSKKATRKTAKKPARKVKKQTKKTRKPVRNAVKRMKKAPRRAKKTTPARRR